MSVDAPALFGLLTLSGVVGVALFERLMLSGRLPWPPPYRWGLPLAKPLPDIPARPTGAGRTDLVLWDITPRGARFWADPSARSSPMGLHGFITMREQQGRVSLHARWSPPWTPMLASGWLLVLGTLRDELSLTAPIALGLFGLLLWVYHRAATQGAHSVLADWNRQ